MNSSLSTETRVRNIKEYRYFLVQNFVASPVYYPDINLQLFYPYRNEILAPVRIPLLEKNSVDKIKAFSNTVI